MSQKVRYIAKLAGPQLLKVCFWMTTPCTLALLGIGVGVIVGVGVSVGGAGVAEIIAVGLVVGVEVPVGAMAVWVSATPIAIGSF